jgi:hypothetical protein
MKNRVFAGQRSKERRRSTTGRIKFDSLTKPMNSKMLVGLAGTLDQD